MKLVVKIGGAALDDKDLAAICPDDSQPVPRRIKLVIVHGGGAALSQYQQLGCATSSSMAEKRFQTRDVALMVRRSAQQSSWSCIGGAGQPAIGLCEGPAHGVATKKKQLILATSAKFCAVDSNGFPKALLWGSWPCVQGCLTRSLARGF